MTLFQGTSTLWEEEYCLFDNYEMTDNLFSKAMELIPDDPFEAFLNAEDNLFRTIHSDCQDIESGSSSPASDMSVTSSEEIFESTNKYEIRNHDCMWSGNCDLNKDGKSTCGYHHMTNEDQLFTPKDCQLILMSSNNNNNNNNISSNRTAQSIQNIPPGGSLLINSRSNQQKKQQQQQQQQQHQLEKFKIPNLLTSDFLRDRESMAITRPDTPVSLDDDAPEFKHTVDLSACVMGSNNICLDDDRIIINKLKEQLEDTSTRSLDIKNIIPGNKNRTLSEVLNVIGKVENDSSLCADSDSDSESTSSSVMYKDSPPSSQQSNSFYQSVMHDDHSYTRSKAGVDVVGLETPSDSDEEIDVVSVGDKKLPTNPSDKDRRVIQNKVAHRISSRIVKTPGGIRTIPPRRRGSLDPPYYPPAGAVASHHNHHHQLKSSPVSKQTSPTSTPYSTSSGYSSVSSVNRYAATTGGVGVCGGRKRGAVSGNITTSPKDDYVPPSSKRYKNKNKKTIGKKAAAASYDMDEADTIEKRNLHNDMERQRRIGLKNLFEALKKQIPNIMDKERAPKVNILREAATLCSQLTIEEDTLSKKKRLLQGQLHRLQAQIKASRILT